MYLVTEVSANPGRLLLECSKRPEIALGCQHCFDVRRRSNQFVFQVLYADEEPKPFHVSPIVNHADTTRGKRLPEERLFGCVAQSGQFEICTVGSEQSDVAPDGLGSAHGKNYHAFGLKVASLPGG